MIGGAMRLTGLALRDLRHEWPITLCVIVGVAATLAPLLILFGLKYGLVTNLLRQLREDPRTREIRLVGQGRFEPGWFEALAGRPDIAFVIPMTRFLTASMDVTAVDAEDGRKPVVVELFPTAAGDPLLTGFTPIPERPDQVVITRAVAEELSIGAGGRLRGLVGRLVGGNRQSEAVELSVVGVLPAGRLQRRALFITLPFLTAVEAYREGATERLESADDQQGAGQPRVYASFRLYARSVYDVAGLRDWFAGKGLAVVTDAAAIERVIRLDQSLTGLFGVVSGLAGCGLLLTMALSFWASVSRKRRELCTLRLLGFTSWTVALFPVLQAVAVAGFGALMATAVYLGAQPLIERSLAGEMGKLVASYGLAPAHFLIAFAATVAASSVASALAGWRAARLNVPEGLRDG